MDIQKEREAFENWHIRNMDINSDFEKISEQDSPYMDEHVNNSWLTWQAAIARMEVRINTLDEMLLNQGEALAEAKAQVSEGYVVVPMEPTEQILNRMTNTPIEVNHLCDNADIFLSEDEARIAYKAMIEAQDPAND